MVPVIAVRWFQVVPGAVRSLLPTGGNATSPAMLLRSPRACGAHMCCCTVITDRSGLPARNGHPAGVAVPAGPRCGPICARSASEVPFACGSILERQ